MTSLTSAELKGRLAMDQAPRDGAQDIMAQAQVLAEAPDTSIDEIMVRSATTTVELARVAMYHEEIIKDNEKVIKDQGVLIQGILKEMKDNETRKSGAERVRRVVDSKSAHNLKIFSGGRKEEFKEWNDKLVNQFSMLYPTAR